MQIDVQVSPAPVWNTEVVDDDRQRFSPAPSFKKLAALLEDGLFVAGHQPHRRIHSVSVNGQHAGFIGIEKAPVCAQTMLNAETYFLIGIWLPEVLREGLSQTRIIGVEAVKQLAAIVVQPQTVVGLYATVETHNAWAADVLREASFKQMIELPDSLKLLNQPTFHIGVETLL